MWEELPEDVRPRLDAETGLPAAGTDVKVPAAWRIELDADTAVGHLELDGELSFPRGRDIVLSVETLKMSVGELKAGTKDRPHDSKVCVSSCCATSQEDISLHRVQGCHTVRSTVRQIIVRFCANVSYFLAVIAQIRSLDTVPPPHIPRRQHTITAGGNLSKAWRTVRAKRLVMKRDGACR